MSIMSCYTCGAILSDKQIYYEQELSKICDKHPEHSDEASKLKEKLLDEMCLERYCCRMRMLTYVKVSSIVK